MFALLLQKRIQQPPCPCSAECEWNAAKTQDGIKFGSLKIGRIISEIYLGSATLVSCNY